MRALVFIPIRPISAQSTSKPATAALAASMKRRCSRSIVRNAAISDVAREAGTGKTSVSRYLNGETHVLSVDLRQRIEAAIARLNYRPNQ
ncbi:LacI family DNA-binding transcriptional regulator, partial [Bacillus licheniformis]|nr:LacI family DNA-binding transcriptional regulator [Bacillus licheniformis]